MHKYIVALLLSVPFLTQAMEQSNPQEHTNPWAQEQPKQEENNDHVAIEMGEPKLPVPLTAPCARCRDTNELQQTNTLVARMLTHSNLSRGVKHTLTMAGLAGLYWLAHSLGRAATALENNICN